MRNGSSSGDDMIEVIADPVQLMKVGQALTNMEAENFIRPELDTFTEAVIDEASPYPPQSPEARYERTQHLGDSWSQTIQGLDAKVKNAAEYAGWVLTRNPRHAVGAKRKMRMGWKFGWKETYTVMQEEMDKWIVMMEHKAFRLWER